MEDASDDGILLPLRALRRGATGVRAVTWHPDPRPSWPRRTEPGDDAGCAVLALLLALVVGVAIGLVWGGAWW